MKKLLLLLAAMLGLTLIALRQRLAVVIYLVVHRSNLPSLKRVRSYSVELHYRMPYHGRLLELVQKAAGILCRQGFAVQSGGALKPLGQPNQPNIVLWLEFPATSPRAARRRAERVATAAIRLAQSQTGYPQRWSSYHRSLTKIKLAS